MRVPDLPAVLAHVTGETEGRFAMLARYLRGAGLLPVGSGSSAPPATADHAVLLLLAHLTGADYGSAARRVADLARYVNIHDDGDMCAAPFIRRTLAAALHVDTASAGEASISVVSGDRPAVIVCLGAETRVFTPGGAEYRPASGQEVARTTTLPGLPLRRLARAVAPLLSGHSLMATWRDGMDAQLARMEAHHAA